MEHKSENRICQNCKSSFIIEPDDFAFYGKIGVPAPTFCPQCRMLRRMVCRNESRLFRKKDALNGTEVFSGFPESSNVNIYDNSYWYSDDWDPLDYDFSRSFFEQFKELFERVPLPARSSMNMVDSPYCNEASNCRNSYLCFDSDYIENSAYLIKSTNIKDSFDSYEVIDNELCYENVMVYKSYRTFFSLDCENCVDVWFSKGLRGCTECFGCVNLKGKSNYFFNEPLSKDEYKKKVAEFKSSSHKALQAMRQRSFDFWGQFPVKYYHGLRNLNCTGERIFDSKNVHNSLSVQGGENIKHCQVIILNSANCYDSTINFMQIDNSYECCTCGDGSFNLKFCFNCWSSSKNLEYCCYAIGASDCFGCVGTMKKQYCILNKQYTKEDYFETVEKIKKQMMEKPYIDKQGNVYKYGEFFPAEFSPLAYNQSMAQIYFPLSAEVANKSGFVWEEDDLNKFKVSIQSQDLPDDLQETSKALLKENIGCGVCGRAFKIIDIEEKFLKQNNLPVPRTCHFCRFDERLKLILNNTELYSRSCMCDNQSHTNHSSKCSEEFQTPYSPERPEIINCESCYQQEVM